MAITKIPAAGFTGNNFRNIIINGDMSIAQRGTSVSGVNSSGYRSLDRFNQGFTGSNVGTWTQSQSTDVPTGQGFAKSLKLDCTTARASLSADESLRIEQKFEGQNLQYLKKGTSSANSTTLSFWVKSNKTGTYICQLRDIDNSRSISKSYTISSASTWEKKTITYDGDTTGAFDNDNGDSLRLLFFLAAGSNYSSGTLGTTWGTEVTANRAVGQVNLADSTSNEWYITGVQLEVGTSASDFEFLPYDVNLNRCLRYYEVFAEGDNQMLGMGGDYSATNNAFIGNYYTKRTVPSASINSGSYYQRTGSGATTTITTFGIYQTTTKRTFLYASSGASPSVKNYFYDTISSSAYIAFDAEL